MTFSAARDLLQIEHALERSFDGEAKTYMKDCDGHREVRSASDVESECVADTVEQFEVFRTAIGDGNGRRLFFDFKRDLRHFYELFLLKLLHNIFHF